MLAVCLLHTHDQKCQQLVLEVGCGGATDATNAVSHQVAIITNVGEDHMPLLGNTVEEIAAVKAGIIPDAGIFITSERSQGILKMFEERCRQQQSQCHVLIDQVRSGDEQVFRHDHYCGHQQLVDFVLQTLGEPFKKDSESLLWLAGRWNHSTLPNNRQLVIDGAHNRNKMALLSDYLAGLGWQRTAVLLAVKEDKDVTGMLAELAPFQPHYLVWQAFGELGESTQSAQKLAQRLQNAQQLLGIRTVEILGDGPGSFEDLSAWLNSWLQDDKDQHSPHLLISGSFLAVREAATILAS
jgi:folylpolyglutamate synthase/dihydropteroate synthase